jgi:hypothetical protein
VVYSASNHSKALTGWNPGRTASLSEVVESLLDNLQDAGRQCRRGLRVSRRSDAAFLINIARPA